ncbi:MAG TPA: D-glycero-beta-D-manno-heptose 1-phosphate adenylyltransferase, partial [Candidatus Eisenbacteria bacterium]|nr:D-glycero-beta-D-manno-heptose 1-phosphate adenylyltransferase [Candidatus Eisenbacteria bacterium]
MTSHDERYFREVSGLAARVRAARGQGGRLVLANGCFDVLHVGHVRYLEGAAAQGEILVVALNDDESTRRLKGPGRPVFPEDERAEMLLAMRPVDFVLLFSGDTVDGVIRELRPDVHAKGTDYTVDSVPEIETAREVGCVTVIVGDP